MTRIDLIKRGDALDALQIVAAWSTKEQRRALSQAYDKLHRVAAVDADLIRHSHWVKCAGERFVPAGAYGYCHLCHFYDSEPYNWCHGCGAKMDGGAKDEMQRI